MKSGLSLKAASYTELEVIVIQIKRIGNYLEVDEYGRLQSRADAANIGSDWQPAVEMLVSAYTERWGKSIHSIYVRGSLAKGLAVKDVSDIDSFAVLESGKALPSYEQVGPWAHETEARIREAYPFVSGVEVGLEAFSGLEDRDNPYTFILKTEAACVYGHSLIESVEPYELSPEIAIQTRYFEQHLAQFTEEYPDEPEAEKPEFIVWLMRRFLRLGMELVMLDERRYARDLYFCYESFAKHYPDQDAQMYYALELAINPETGATTESFVQRFGAWLSGEAERKLLSWSYFKDSGGSWVR